MKALLKKGTRQVNQEKREECLKNWGIVAYSAPPRVSQHQSNAINMNELLHSKSSKTI